MPYLPEEEEDHTGDDGHGSRFSFDIGGHVGPALGALHRHGIRSQHFWRNNGKKSSLSAAS